jgi:hypothetical protein
MPSYSGVFTLQAQMQAIAAGTWTGIPLVIGQAYQGGYYAGQISTAGNGVADFNLVAGPLSTAQSSLQWKTSDTSTSGTSSNINGPANSAAMNDANHPAAQFCEGLSIGGYSDWYMPARLELDVCYFGLKPTTTSNNTGAGVNAYSVPTRTSPYTTGTPAQTSAASFQSGGSEAFASSGTYWTSTENSASYAWYTFFSNGYQYRRGKTGSRNVRAIRRVAV